MRGSINGGNQMENIVVGILFAIVIAAGIWVWWIDHSSKDADGTEK